MKQNINYINFNKDKTINFNVIRVNTKKDVEIQKDSPQIHHRLQLENQSMILKSNKHNHLSKKINKTKKYDDKFDKDIDSNGDTFYIYNKVRNLSLNLKKIMDNLSIILTIICTNIHDSNTIINTLKETLKLYNFVLTEIDNLNVTLFKPFTPLLNKCRNIVKKLKDFNHTKSKADDIIIKINKKHSYVLRVFLIYEDSLIKKNGDSINFIETY